MLDTIAYAARSTSEGVGLPVQHKERLARSIIQEFPSQGQRTSSAHGLTLLRITSAVMYESEVTYGLELIDTSLGADNYYGQ